MITLHLLVDSAAVTINGSIGQSDDNIAMTNKKYD